MIADRPWTTTHSHFLQMGGFRLHATTFENCFTRDFIGPDETYFTTIRKRPVALFSDLHIFRPRNASDICRKAHKQVAGLSGVYCFDEISEEDAARADFGDDIREGVLTFDTMK